MNQFALNLEAMKANSNKARGPTTVYERDFVVELTVSTIIAI